mgnify:CR=1 FL=1
MHQFIPVIALPIGNVDVLGRRIQSDQLQPSERRIDLIQNFILAHQHRPFIFGNNHPCTIVSVKRAHETVESAAMDDFSVLLDERNLFLDDCPFLLRQLVQIQFLPE